MAKCPICGYACFQHYAIKDEQDKITRWFTCYCGCIFHCQPRDDSKKRWNEKYIKDFNDIKRLSERVEHFIRLYIPIIEELIYGRKFLDVGFTYPLIIDRMKQRGWISTGIDLMKNQYATGDFNVYDFDTRKYDFILMNDVVQCFDEPVKALHKAYNLLNNNGILLILTPDAELIYLQHHPKEFNNWSTTANRLFFSKRQLRKTVERIGFNILVNCNNMADRLFQTNEMHFMLQKPTYVVDVKGPATDKNNDEEL